MNYNKLIDYLDYLRQRDGTSLEEFYATSDMIRECIDNGGKVEISIVDGKTSIRIEYEDLDLVSSLG